MKDLKIRRVTRREAVIDDFHGTMVADPYRWLEKDSDPEVGRWIDGQNADFQAYVGGIAERDGIRARLRELWDYDSCSTPVFVDDARRGGVYYAWRLDGLRNQPVLFRYDRLDAPGEVVLDPNLLSEDGTVAVGASSFSPKGDFLAYSLSESGSDWCSVRVLDLATGRDLPDILRHVKFSGLSWLPDESGFVYSRFPKPATDAPLESQTLNQYVCLHLLGRDQGDDEIVHKDDAHPEYLYGAYTDLDKRWLFLSTVRDTLPVNRLHYKPLSDLASPWIAIADGFDMGCDVIDAVGDVAYIETRDDAEAPFGRIESVRLTADGPKDRKIVVPDSGERLEWVAMVNSHLLCCHLSHAVSCLSLYDLEGRRVRAIDLPAPGSVGGCSGRRNREEFFIGFTNYLHPGTILRLDFSGGEPTVWFAPCVDFPFGDYETEQKFYESKDGTRVPIFVTRRRGIPLDGSHPTLLYGYGGFTHSMTPHFSPANLAWLERGGIYAVACIRGGAEYGEAWHRAGMLESKQNTFDDFIAAGEFLISEGYTRRERLSILGGSNGGLLTAACLVQRPDLFGAVVVAVPVIDMMRYHLFTAGRLWIGEYGCAENPEQFPFMYAYSPLHNVRMNAAHPATLILTADTDDRVVPGQARKFAATLQAADGGENPILIRIEKSAGHGAGKPTAKIIDEKADMFAFLLANLCRE